MGDTAAREVLGEPVTVDLTEERHIAEARREARALAEEIGLRRVTAFCIIISVSELASNLVFHASRGGRHLACRQERRRDRHRSHR